ncbi:MAG: glutamine--tRNA ligase/YqeY domain fusion protein [Clostridiales bacterium]|nr:glutamine--tRNA ligase/YqeY domain fusion protein [Clostridiales bacterium]
MKIFIRRWSMAFATKEEYTKMAGNFIHDIIDEDLRTEKHTHIITRFPPEPNGYLHVGHAKSLCLNFGTALKYGGTCNLRYDDTNPVKEDIEFVKSIENDVNWLGFQWDKKLWASDYFDTMYEAAVELIKKNKAFVCELTPEQIREHRGTLTNPGTESPYRNRPIEESLELFEKMRAGEFEDGEVCLRAKIDMASPNINMRDPVIYRVVHASHHNTGDKWCVYPMYDFAHPIEDAIEGITHSLCTLEFEDHRPLYDWVINEVGFWPNPPRQIEFARLNITTMLMSKRLLKKLVDDGSVSGWDDPRLPTLAGLRRRGYTPESIRKFCDDIGVSKADSTIDIAQLEQCAREDLQSKVSAINVITNPIKVVIDNYPEDKIEMCTVENNSKVPEMGNREIPFGREIWIDGDDFMEVPARKYFRLYPGNEVRLKGAYFITCNEVVKNEDGSVKELHCTYDPETKSGSDFTGRKVKGTIHFVEASTAVKVGIREYGYLLTENEETGDQEFDKDSLVETWGYAEPSVKGVKPGERFQFFRKGYYIADTEMSTEDNKVFNSIVGLKSSWK